MLVKTIFQFIGLCISYGILIYGTIAFAFRVFLKDKSFSQRFLFETIVGNFYIINIVFFLELLKISNPYTLRIMIFGGAILIRYFTDKDNMLLQYSSFLEIIKRIIKKEYGIKLFLKIHIREIVFAIKEYSIFVFGKRKLEWLLFLIPTIFNFYHYGYFAFTYFTVGAPDVNTHMMWIQELKKNNPFNTGVYPYGFHNIIYALSDVFNMRIITVMRLLCIIETTIIMTMIYLLLKKICRSRYSPIIAYTLCCMCQLYKAEATFRYQATLPQEYAMIALCPMTIYLFNYLKNKKKEDLILFGMSFSLTIMVHFYVTIIAGLICLAVGITYLVRIIKKKYFIKLMTCGILSLFVAILPLGVGYLEGYGLEPSLNWALKIINDSSATTKPTNNDKEEITSDEDENIETSDIIETEVTSFTEDVEDTEDMSFTEDIEDTEDMSFTENVEDTEDTSFTEDVEDTENMSFTEDVGDTEDMSFTEDVEDAHNYNANSRIYNSIPIKSIVSNVCTIFINNPITQRIVDFCLSKWQDASENIFLKGRRGLFWITLALVFITIINSLVRIKFKFSYEENMMQCSMAVFMLLLFLLVASEEFGLPTIMDFNRSRIFFVYAVPLMVVMLFEIIYEFIENLLNRKNIQNSYVSFNSNDISNIQKTKFNSKRILDIITPTISVILVFLIIFTGNLKQFTFVYYLQRPEAMKAVYNIMDNYPKNKWTIISAVDETYMVINDGRHEELWYFIKQMENWNSNIRYHIPTTYVFLFIEKQPISYSSEFYLKDAPYDTPEITYEDADVGLTDETELSSDYYKRQRRLLMARAYYWAQEYQKYFPNEMHIYFENDYFIIYKIEQSDYYLNNFSIDYGFNTKRYLQ